MGSSTAERKQRAEDRAKMDAEEMRKKQKDMEMQILHQKRRDAELSREKAQNRSDQEMAFRKMSRRDPRAGGYGVGEPHDTRGY